MDYGQKIAEGARLATFQAQKHALENCVYVCTNKEKKTFEFIPLDEVILFPDTNNKIKLSDYLLGLQNTIKGLSQELVYAKSDINTLNGNCKVLQDAVNKLADYVDKQQFL